MDTLVGGARARSSEHMQLWRYSIAMWCNMRRTMSDGSAAVLQVLRCCSCPFSTVTYSALDLMAQLHMPEPRRCQEAVPVTDLLFYIVIRISVSPLSVPFQLAV